MFLSPHDPGDHIKHLEKTAENEVSSFLFWLFIAFIPLAINPNEPGKVVVSAVLDMIAFPVVKKYNQEETVKQLWARS